MCRTGSVGGEVQKDTGTISSSALGVGVCASRCLEPTNIGSSNREVGLCSSQCGPFFWTGVRIRGPFLLRVGCGKGGEKTGKDRRAEPRRLLFFPAQGLFCLFFKKFSSVTLLLSFVEDFFRSNIVVAFCRIWFAEVAPTLTK